jgi:hypothetical protein
MNDRALDGFLTEIDDDLNDCCETGDFGLHGRKTTTEMAGG